MNSEDTPEGTASRTATGNGATTGTGAAVGVSNSSAKDEETANGGAETGEDGGATGFSVAGTVYWNGTQERAVGALVNAMSSDGTLAPLPPVQSDDDGDFAFSGVAPGNWTFVAFHPDIQTRQDGRVRSKTKRSTRPGSTCDSTYTA
jgi:hypothetical protein